MINPNATWPDKTGPNWHIALDGSWRVRWRGTGPTPGEALANARQDVAWIATVLSGGRYRMPETRPLPTGRMDDGRGDPEWASSFSAGDCDVEVDAGFLTAVREKRWWQVGKTGPHCTAEEAVAAAGALARLFARRLLRDEAETLAFWLGSDGNQSQADERMAINLCPFIRDGSPFRGHAPVPAPFRAAMAAASATYAHHHGIGIMEILEGLPASATVRAVWRNDPAHEADAALVARFTAKAGLPGEAAAILRSEEASKAAREAR